MRRPRPVLPSLLKVNGPIQLPKSLASKSLKMSQAFPRASYSLEGRSVEQYTRLIAVLRYAVPFQIQIREKERCVGIVLGNRPPQPLRGFRAIAALAIGTIQITLGDREFVPSPPC